ncbi:TRAP transporter small permease [Oceanobacillus indicireducens]|uniref:Tripartite ATP-independent periplasmic transporters DctQ component domain-containing protein n=1 Tax=Oceanobacillus indicireducens TaxID=1004261 RepID=A0A918CZV4_9BACI|nr:TRAP transporter small permease [Oceanobacillus indicireducens]GGN52528.1 hypothetical protein GCM10007971_08220 [Oceanobacillus indicireducens]
MKVKEIIAKILVYLCVVAITGLTVIVFLQVLTRMVSISFPGADELARLLVVWLTFFGSSLAIYEKMHLAVTFFVKRARPTIQKMIHFSVHLLTILFFGILAYYGFGLTMGAMSTTSSTLQLPMGLFYLAIPLSSLFSIYFIVTDIFRSTGEGEPTV